MCKFSHIIAYYSLCMVSTRWCVVLFDLFKIIFHFLIYITCVLDHFTNCKSYVLLNSCLFIWNRRKRDQCLTRRSAPPDLENPESPNIKEALRLLFFLLDTLHRWRSNIKALGGFTHWHASGKGFLYTFPIYCLPFTTLCRIDGLRFSFTL